MTNLMDNWALAFLPLVGIVIGATAQFWFSRAAEREKQTGSLRSQAYADYLRAVAAAAHLRTDDDLRNAHRDLADAKARICIYGTAPVIKALSRFEETGRILNNQRSVKEFVSLVTNMRSGRSVVAVRELQLVLVGNDSKPDTC
jgi:proline dehydrogenase